MSLTNGNTAPSSAPPRRKYVRTVGPRLRVLLLFVLGLSAILGANSVYLASITFLEWLKGVTFQNYFYLVMFGLHLALGLLLIVPVVVFGAIHLSKSYDRPNRRAVAMGYALLAISLVVLFTGVALMRVGNFDLKNPTLRSFSYWAHVITPVLAAWLYVLHRLAGPRIKWRAGLGLAGATLALVVASVLLHSQHPRKSEIGSVDGVKYFQPSEARTASGKFIPARTLMMDDYCKKCHEDGYNGWFHSAHHFSSFNNQPYMFSVRETRAVALARDGNVKASRWCAGCHDVVPFFSGAFDDPGFDMEKHPTAKAGITCTACHAINHINSTIGNGAYTIDEPIHYPFAYSTNAALQWVNNTLVKAKPDFHKQTFLKPLHKTAEFCSVCHKVSIPRELNHYKAWLRGQNHYDGFLLSGVSHGARSFYYPEKTQPNCAGCHMPLQASSDFGAKYFNNTNVLSIHDHLFPAANTGLAHLRGETNIVKRHEDFLKGALRVDIFGVKEGGTVDSPLTAPLRPQIPALRPGRKYLLEVVLRTLRLGHPFTQGTTDSNEVWVDAKVTSAGRVLGRSGGLGPHNEVDPWAHFVNTYMLDRHGNRIDRRNPQDIFTPLYNHQIPPGAAQVGHYEFTVPADQTEPITVEVRLNYRKFDTIYMNYVFGTGYTNGQPFQVTNDLPIVTIASDKIVFPVQEPASTLQRLNASTPLTNAPSSIPEWQRWNDYGIGLLLEGDKGSEKGELIQSAHAFSQVERLGRADGPLNLARVFFKEGRLDDTVTALQRANNTNLFNPPGYRWTIAWLNGLVNKQNGFLDKAATEFRSILEDRSPELERRGLDFSKDYEVINELGVTLFERAKSERGDETKRRSFLQEAADCFRKTLALDSENLAAHYNLALIYAQLGDSQRAEEHRSLHEKYRPDDNARDRAFAAARRADPAADHAAQAIVIYPLQRAGAPGLSATPHKELSATVAAPAKKP